MLGGGGSAARALRMPPAPWPTKVGHGSLLAPLAAALALTNNMHRKDWELAAPIDGGHGAQRGTAAWKPASDRPAGSRPTPGVCLAALIRALR